MIKAMAATTVLAEILANEDKVRHLREAIFDSPLLYCWHFLCTHSRCPAAAAATPGCGAATAFLDCRISFDDSFRFVLIAKQQHQSFLFLNQRALLSAAC